MKTLGILLLLGLLSLWTALPPACGQKLGKCRKKSSSTKQHRYSSQVFVEPYRPTLAAPTQIGRVQLTTASLLSDVMLTVWLFLITEKRGYCPVDTCSCSRPQPDQCESDFPCEGKKKCCLSCCALRCVDPDPRLDLEFTVKAMGIQLIVALLALWTQMPSGSSLPPRDKPGICPPSPYRCSSPDIDFCSIDYDCPGIQKCCDFDCRKVCRDPQEKPGTCPPNPFRCTIPGKNRCENDDYCPLMQKCCYFNCGKICRDPQSPQEHVQSKDSANS
ncbi:hypothetical protein lerEdw1_002008 [Lerista edwardsae]|nr:hypothetical protein lerEdw1_002008 [Lerista edwardsae]